MNNLYEYKILVEMDYGREYTALLPILIEINFVKFITLSHIFCTPRVKLL